MTSDYAPCATLHKNVARDMPPVRMDYDKTNIASTYDLGRSHGREVLDLWMHTVSRHAVPPVRTILDLGCGTGRFSEALAAHFDAAVIGVDPSTKMLEQARRKRVDGRVRYENGRGESIPLRDHSTDLVFISMIFHHLEDAHLAARECRRVLREGGIVFVRAATREHIPSYPYVDFFPASRPILERVLQPGTFVREVFEGAGFGTRAIEVVTQCIAPDLDAYTDKLATKSDSILASLSDDDFEAGIKAMRAHTSVGPVIEPIDVFVFSI